MSPNSLSGACGLHMPVFTVCTPYNAPDETTDALLPPDLDQSISQSWTVCGALAQCQEHGGDTRRQASTPGDVEGAEGGQQPSSTL